LKGLGFLRAAALLIDLGEPLLARDRRRVVRARGLLTDRERALEVRGRVLVLLAWFMSEVEILERVDQVPVLGAECLVERRQRLLEELLPPFRP
jgi:hypothetical protein